MSATCRRHDTECRRLGKKTTRRHPTCGAKHIYQLANKKKPSLHSDADNKYTEPLPSLLNPHSSITSPFPHPIHVDLEKVDCWIRLAAVDGGSDAYTAALSTTRKYQTLNEATHELLCENEEARLPQSLATEDDRSSHFVQRIPICAQQWSRYKFPLVKFNSGAVRYLKLPPWVWTPR